MATEEQPKRKRGRPPLSDEERARRRSDAESSKRRKKYNANANVNYTPTPSPIPAYDENGGEGGQPKSTVQRIADLMRTNLRCDRVDEKDPEALIERAEGYVEYCRQNSVVPMLAGLCASMGIDRARFNELLKGSERVHSSNEVRETLAKIKEVIASGFQACAAAGEVSNAVAVLVMTNEQNYLDTKKIEHVREVNVQVEAVSDLQKLKAKYGTEKLVADNHLVIDTTCTPVSEPVAEIPEKTEK